MIDPVHKALVNTESAQQPSSDLKGLSSQFMGMVDSVITSSSLNSLGNTASMNCRKMKIQPRKSIHKVIPASEVSDLTTHCILVNCNQVGAVQCPNEDSQLNIGKEAKFVYCEHSTMCIKDTSCLALEDIMATGWESDTDCPASDDITATGWDMYTGFPASEDIIATGWESSSHSYMSEPGCSEMNSLSSDLAGAVDIQSVPCDNRFVSSDLCPSNSDMVYTGILRSNSGCTRFNSQVKSSSSGWSRNRMIPNGFQKFQMDSREFGNARSANVDQSYTENLSVVNSSLAPIKCLKNEARHSDISTSNQTYRAKPMGSDFVWQRIGTRNTELGSHAPRQSYVENNSVAETTSTGSSPSNQFSLDQQQLSSELPYAVHNVPHQNAHRSAYKMNEGIYWSCGQEAAVPPMCSFDRGFGISGVQCTIIDFSVPQQGDSQCYYGHDLFASSSAPSFFLSDDAELIFEYFEHDQPQNRKPLPQTIVEIKEKCSSNPRSFGDPSELDQLKLHDLHPASWYSVAWYPIYRIPESNRTNIPPLRASFLTYHSLSHLVMIHESPDQLGNSSLCVVPALGMRRYNGKMIRALHRGIDGSPSRAGTVERTTPILRSPPPPPHSPERLALSSPPPYSLSHSSQITQGERGAAAPLHSPPPFPSASPILFGRHPDMERTRVRRPLRRAAAVSRSVAAVVARDVAVPSLRTRCRP